MNNIEVSPAVIADEAADWVVRLASGVMTDTDRADFQRWQDLSPVHRAALEKEQQFWESLEALRPAFAEVANKYPAEVVVSKVFPRRSHRVWHGAIAATLLLLAMFLGLFWPAAGDYSTVAGEVRTVSLPDGSSVVLNTRTRIAINFSEQLREITLLQGEAWFDVAPNPQRPFRVYAAGGYTEAVGTSFNIRTRNEQVLVAVTSGQVKVEAAAYTGRFAPVFASKGETLTYTKKGARGPAIAQVSEHLLAWRQGWIEIDELPLPEALAELNRYLPGKVVLIAPALGDVQVSGSFRQAQLVDALDALAATQQLKVLRLTSFLHIIY